MPTIQVKKNHIVLGVGTKNKTSIKKMKKVVLFCCALLCTTVLMAQQQLATLKHNDSISVYYGTNAFVQAYNAAVDGDVITLSDGVFRPCGINKSITVRGNGALPDTTKGSMGTQFFEDFNVSEGGSSFSFGAFEAEGIYFHKLKVGQHGEHHKVTLKKCIVDDYHCGHTIYSTVAINCILNSHMVASSCVFENNTGTHTFINSVLNSEIIPWYSTCTNCIIRGDDDPYNYNSNNTYNSNYTNCIVINIDSTDSILERNCSNSILCGYLSVTHAYSQGNVSMNMSDVFENWNGDSILFQENAYMLKNSVVTSILGTDGTQMGIYGGVVPFGLTPTYNSFIKKCDVATRTTSDGKLSVDIEVVTE